MEYTGVIKIKFLIVIINTNSIIQVIRINKIIINKWDMARPFMSTFAVLFHVT